MQRRKFLGLSSSDPVEAVKLRTAADGLEPFQGTWTEVQAKHLLKRTMFGAAFSDIRDFTAATMNSCVEELLHTPETEPLPPVNNYSPGVADDNVPAGTTWIHDTAAASGTLSNNRRNSLNAWWWGQIFNQSRTLREKMVLFWHNHFALEYPGINPRYLYQYNVVLRKNALGNFRTFLREMTLNSAMLVYLNGNRNTAAAPNENYARELQELFAIGKGPDSHYTESDVQQAARVLTGYEINSATTAYVFKASKHDSGNKTFSAFYNHKTIVGKSGTAGEEELDELLGMLFDQQELSKFICRKLYRFFVYYVIDEQIEKQVIEPLAEIFRQSNYEIKPVLAALFKSSHFYHDLNIGCMIKSPIDFLGGMMREYQVKFPDINLYLSEVYWHWRNIGTNALNQGEELGNPPGVAGWPAYYQEPQFHQLWINSNSLPLRNKFSDTMIATGYSRNGRRIIIDVLGYVASLPEPGDPDMLVSRLVNNLFMNGISQNSRDFIKKEMLLSGQDSNQYWTTAWNNYVAAPTNNTYKNIVLSRLQSLLKYLMNLPEYQLS